MCIMYILCTGKASRHCRAANSSPWPAGRGRAIEREEETIAVCKGLQNSARMVDYYIIYTAPVRVLVFALLAAAAAGTSPVWMCVRVGSSTARYVCIVFGRSRCRRRCSHVRHGGHTLLWQRRLVSMS